MFLTFARASAARAIVFAAALLSAAPAAAAWGGGEQAFKIGDGELTGRVFTNWPGRVAGGYYPVMVEIHNNTGSTQEVDLRVRRSYIKDSTEKGGIIIKPRESAMVEVPAPSFYIPREWERGAPSRSANTLFTVEIGAGGKIYTLHNIGANDEIDADSRAVLFVTSRAALPGEEATWSSALSWKTAKRASRRASPPPRAENVNVCAASPAQISRRLECYTSLSAVIIDANDGLPPPRCARADARVGAARRHARRSGAQCDGRRRQEQRIRGVDGEAFY